MKPFAYEWARLRTLRSTWIMSIICLVFSVLAALLAFVIATSGSDSGAKSLDQDQWINSLVAIVPTVIGICATLIGAYAFGHEYRYGTIRPTLTTIPVRQKLGLAKVVVPGVFSLVLAAVTMLLTLGMSWVAVRNKLSGPAFSGAMWRSLFGVTLFCAGNAMIGAGLCAITRSQVFTLVSTILFKIVIEPILFIILVAVKFLKPIKGVAGYLPYQSGAAMYSAPQSGNAEGPGIDFKPLSALGGGAVFFTFALILCAIGIWRFTRSDA